jgi:hypothetical protein
MGKENLFHWQSNDVTTSKATELSTLLGYDRPQSYGSVGPNISRVVRAAVNYLYKHRFGLKVSDLTQ